MQLRERTTNSIAQTVLILPKLSWNQEAQVDWLGVSPRRRWQPRGSIQHGYQSSQLVTQHGTNLSSPATSPNRMRHRRSARLGGTSRLLLTLLLLALLVTPTRIAAATGYRWHNRRTQ